MRTALVIGTGLIGTSAALALVSRGVTVHLADHVLGTFPQKSDVENSPTARTLGIDPEG